MELVSTMGWNHIAIKEKGMRDIWLRDNSDIYILYLDNTQDTETCSIVRMQQDSTSGREGGMRKFTKKDAQSIIDKLGDGSGFIDRNVNAMPEYAHEIFELRDYMPRIHAAMEHYKEQRRS